MGYLGKEPRKDGGSLTLGATLDVNGNEVVLDADADTSITADTDDQIDIRIAGADDFQFTTNTFTIGSGSAADTKIVFDGNAQDYHIGLDDSTDSLTIGKGSALGTTAHIISDADGHVTMPLQPAFSVTSNQMNNLAINNTTTIQFANEIFDLNADFNTSNYTFTAPVTGKYMLNVNLRMDNVDIDHSYMYMILATSNREYEWLLDISEYQNDLDYLPFTINVLADMDASDTAQVKMHIPNAGAAQSDVVGSNKTTFSGFLAC